VATIYWVPGAAPPYPTYPPALPAIGIQDSPQDPPGQSVFRQVAVQALEELADLPSGFALLNSIIARLGTCFNNGWNWGVSVGSTQVGNYCQGVVAPGPPNPGPRTTLVRCFYEGGMAGLPNAITAAMNAMGIPAPGGYQTVANAMNNCPTYQFQGHPAAAPSNFGVTAAHVQAWATGAAVFPNPLPASAALQRALTNALIVALRTGMQPGDGYCSNVRWNPNSQMVVNALRPAFIGLAHELIHARNNLYGIELGTDDAWLYPVTTTVLYEYQCVGLGPWYGRYAGGTAANPGAVAGVPLITENQVRMDVDWPLREVYD
jgi:hypothetical protein